MQIWFAGILSLISQLVGTVVISLYRSVVIVNTIIKYVKIRNKSQSIIMLLLYHCIIVHIKGHHVNFLESSL